MFLPLPIRLAAFAAACLFSAGCGGSSAPITPTKTQKNSIALSSAAPRTLELPANVQPLVTIDERGLSAAGDDSLAVQLAQASAPGAAVPRIRELSATPDSAARGMIREPGAAPAEVTEPAPQLATAAPRQNSYVPLTIPETARPTAGTHPPQLADRPTFEFSPESQPAPALALAAPQSGPYTAASTPANPPAFSPMPLPAEALAPMAKRAESPAFAPSPAAATSPAMLTVVERATQISDQALVMAQRGLLFSARSELIKAMQLVAQALDTQEGAGVHATALAAGLTALEEAGDFAKLAARPGEEIKVAEIASGHRTPVLKGNMATAISPVVAQQQYFALAQSQLAIAAGGVPAASQTLYRLGRLHSGLAATNSESQSLHTPQAMVFHQAALATDGANYLAANELGVMLARFGQLPDARRLLLHSVTVHPHVEGWHNLAVVHQRLGEADLAVRAEHERDLVAKRAESPSVAKNPDAVRWVDAKTFAASRAADVPWRENADKELAASPAGQRR
jgi:hypothetical protein